MINEQKSTKAYSTTDITETKNCKQHQLPIQFVCTEPKCRINAFLCAECLPNHRSHLWETLTNIYKEINTIHKDEYINSDRATVIQRQIKTLISKFKKRIDRKTIQLQTKITDKIENIKESFDLLSQRSRQVSEQDILSMISTIKSSQKRSSSSIQTLKKFVNESIQAAEAKIITIMNDIELSIDINWVKCTPKERKTSLQSLKQQISEPLEEITPSTSKSLHFDQTLKHAGILLSDDGLSATYQSNASKGPAVILNAKIADKRTFTFQIVKLTHTAFFFPDSTIFLGVCQPSIVKAAGLRRINQSGKGAYLIGSTGWSYHHKLLQFDRKNIVGWRFTEKDRITIQVSLEQPGEIRFTKEGFFFDSDFCMPLALTKNELRNLQPCLSFQSDLGAIVRIVDPEAK